MHWRQPCVRQYNDKNQNMKYIQYGVALLATLLALPIQTHAQGNEQSPELHIQQNSPESFIGKSNDFSMTEFKVPDESSVKDIVWNFGDGARAVGGAVRHIYERSGIYTVRLSIITEKGNVFESTEHIRIFSRVILLLADESLSEEEIASKKEYASQSDVLLLALHASPGGPEVVTEQLLTNQLIEAREAIKKTSVIIVQTSGSVGSNVLSKFAQHIKQASDTSPEDLSIADKGIIMLSGTPFGVLAPAAQSVFNQLKPSYVLLSKPNVLDTILKPLSQEDVKRTIVESNIGHRLLGEFSARTIRDISVTNFMSFGINYLVNKGIPINSITLILMLPVIATILAFSRQVIGMKAFGIVTPAMTTLSFLVLGLQYGLIILLAILASGSITRIAMRRFHLLYLPRMALVLTGASIAILLVFGLAAATDNTALASFSIFPILILALLAEEFIALQFKSGAKNALTVTAWTLTLSIGCYFIVSWQLLRTLFVSYPEIALLAIPINILLGRWTGLRLTEYLRFRRLLRYMQ